MADSWPRDIRQRPGVLLGAAILLHVVLISAQVNTASGLPILQVVTFGSRSPRCSARTTAAIDGVRGTCGPATSTLRQVQQENAALKQELQALQVRLQQERAEAQRTDNLRQLLELRERAEARHRRRRSDRRRGQPGFPHRHHRQGHRRTGSSTDMAVISPAGVVGRVILPSRARLESAAADRSQRRGRRADRAHARAGRGRRRRRRHACACSTCPAPPT